MQSARRRVYGLETEYALVYHPSVLDRRTLDARGIYSVFEALLRERHRTVRAAGHKRGLFLENGALVSFEAQTLRHGLLEMSTPECSSPRQALTWQSALDCMIVDLLPAVHERLRAAGFQGTVVVGKNSTDHHGNYYGTHENYSIDLPWRGSRAGLVLALFAFELMFLLLEIPLVLLVAIGTVGVMLCGMNPRRVGEGEFTRRIFDEPVRLWWLLRKRLSRPFAGFYSRFMERTLLAPLSRGLASYFVTRVAWCGSGLVRDGSLSLMQRADDVVDLSRTIGVRCLFDLKAGGGDAIWALQPRKRLHVTYSDSNMCERSVFLKLGVTGLLLEMLEDGFEFEGVQLARPWQAMDGISVISPLRQRCAAAKR